ncbi:MAG: hypothetical protein GX207_08495 [Peptococcaceae bacterium]|nr:hypothetical protein [Peptococcaceae bacterium]
MKIKKIAIETTKKGYPAHWEQGGGYTNTGVATIIAGKNGEPKKPIYVRARGHLANGKHALIPLEIGDYIIEADHYRKNFYISVMKIVDIEEHNEKTLGNSIENLTVAEYDEKYPPFGDLGETVSQGVNGYPIKKLPNGNYVMAKGRDEIWGYTIYPEVEKIEMYATLEPFANFNKGEWDNKDIERVLSAWEVDDLESIKDIDDEIYNLCRAILAAEEKATCYHCRSPHYIAE